MGALIGIGAHKRIEALISKSTFEGGRLYERARWALNRIITVDGECRNKNCLKGRGGIDVQHKKKKKKN